jgi:hypothetical protein
VRVRRLLLLLALAILFLGEVRTFRPWELKRRAAQLPRLAALPVEAAESAGSIFEDDRPYGSFLDGVRRIVPPGSSVAVLVPATTVRYLYTAHYALAPRPVYDARLTSAADFLAVYSRDRTPGPQDWSVPGGIVRRLP